MSAVGLAGCAGGDSGNEGQTPGGTAGDTGKPELEVWLGFVTEGKRQKEFMAALTSEFESKTGIKINITGVPYKNILQKLLAARAAGSPPHLIDTWINPQLLTAGGVMEVTDLWESSTLPDQVSDKVMKGHYQHGLQVLGEKNTLVSFPLGLKPYLPIWRTDWLEQAGLEPSDVNYKAGSLHWYDDAAPIYEKLQQTKLGKKKGYFPSSTGMKSGDLETQQMYIAQFGGSIAGFVSPDASEPTVTSPETRDAIQFQKEFIEKKYFHPNSINFGDEETTTKHWSKQLAENTQQDVGDAWNAYLSNQRKGMKSGAYTWGVPKKAKEQVTLSTLPGFGFIADAFGSQKEKDAAVSFIEFWVGSDKWMTRTSKTLGWIPATPSTIKSNDFYGKTKLREHFWRGACLKTLQEATPAVVPAVNKRVLILNDIPREMWVRILLKGMSVEKATNIASEEIAKALKGQGATQ
jgi:ABC-type glycerol-3-phosphate transport system substrate-binding protein